jgi:hypothetical protein
LGQSTEERVPELTSAGSRRRPSRPWWRSRRRRARIRRVVKRIAFFATVVAGVCAVVVGISIALVGPSAFRAAREGRTALVEASSAVVRKDAAVARVEFRTASQVFADAARKLDSRLAWPLRIIPVVSTHHGVARSLAEIGSEVARTGVAVADAMDELPDHELTFTDGRVDLDLVRTAQRALDVGVRSAPAIEQAIREMPTAWVGGPLVTPRREVLELLPLVIDGVQKAEAALAGLPSLLAEGGQKRYLVAFSNLSELRGSGGLFGYVTSLRAKDGDLDLGKLSGRPTELFPKPGDVGLEFPSWFPDDLRSEAGIFQNINMTTDFPTVGGFVLDTIESETGPMDGVIAVDPVGIGAVLRLTGPIRVPAWGGEITADNVAKIAMHDVYVEIPNDGERREEFFEQLVRTAFDRLVTTTITLTPQAVGMFDTSVRGGHFRMYSKHADDQIVFDRIGTSGNLRRARGASDVLSVVSENATGNKADWFLRRELRYRVALDPVSGRATTALGVTFRNDAPEAGLPDYIIGSPLPELGDGVSRQIVMLIRGPTDDLTRLTVDDVAREPSVAREGPFPAYRSTIELPAQSRKQLVMGSVIDRAVVGPADQRVFRLAVLRQAVANPDFADIEISVPKGWRAAGQTRFLGDLTTDVTLEVRLERTTRGSLVDRFVLGPWRAVKNVFSAVF